MGRKFRVFRAFVFCLYRVTAVAAYGLCSTLVTGWPGVVLICLGGLYFLDRALSIWAVEEPVTPRVVGKGSIVIDGDDAEEFHRLMTEMARKQQQNRGAN